MFFSFALNSELKAFKSRATKLIVYVNMCFIFIQNNVAEKDRLTHTSHSQHKDP